MQYLLDIVDSPYQGVAGIFSGVKSWVGVSMAGHEPRYNPECGVLTESRAFSWEFMNIRDYTSVRLRR
jgi:hypothetical protein